MKKSSAVLMTVLASACVTALAATRSEAVQWLQPLEPAPVVADEGPVDETPQRWFVELSNAPTSEGGSVAQLRSEKQAFRDAVRKAGVPYIEHYAFDGLFNGFSVTVGRAHLGTLMRMPGVRAIYPVETISRPEPTVSAPEMATALAMTGADIAQNTLGLDGSGIRVAVMDTGIDIDHLDFGGSGIDGTTTFPTARIVAGYDFVGDAFNADPSSSLYNPIPSPDDNPDDCGGHGTHVAGIVGANGAVKGVAPNVQFGAYRVFGCNGSTTADIMVAAMERALADGMHVLNMSIGSTYQWPEYPTAKAASRLVNRRMVVVASAGNSGATGVYSTGAPSVGEKVIAVASFDNTHVRQSVFTVAPDGTKVGYNPASAAPPPPTSGSGTLAATGTTSSTADACAALPAGSLTGRIALVRRGGCTFHLKALNAQNAGAVGVVIYNNAPGAVSATVAGTPAITVPVVGVSDTAGALLDSRIAAGTATITWTSETGSFPNPTGGLLSSFTSYGMSPDLALKPDIGAPGGLIYSTYPIESGSYATLSGTSMAAPHVAGAAALLLQAAPRTPSQAVGRILQNSAEPKVWSLNPGVGLLDVVHRQGAGMLQIDRAIVSAVRVEPGKLSLGESESGPVTRTLKIENTGDTPVAYTLQAVDAVTTADSTFAPSFYWAPSGVTFSATSITVAAGATATVDVTIAPGAGLPSGGQYGGYLVLTPNDGSATLRVPYGGYVGDYQARPVMTPTANGFPWLAKSSGGSYFNQPDGATYTFAGGDIPYFLVHLDHQSRMLRMDVVDAATGRVWQRASEFEYLGRNSSANGFFAYSWDGLVKLGNRTQAVPDGRYRMRLSVLKALGDPTNEAHWERWESPLITVAR